MSAPTRWRAAALAALLATGSCLSLPARATEDQATAIVAIAKKAMNEEGLRAVIVRVTIDGKPIVTTRSAS